jgi:hypothetical protein
MTMPTNKPADRKADPVEKLTDAVSELTERKQRFCYLEHYDRKLKIRVRTKARLGRYSMLDQLETDVARDDDTAPKTAGGGLSAGFESRPPGKFRPRELLTAFTQDLAVWLAWVGLDQRDSPAEHLRGLLTVAPKMVDTYPVDLAAMVQDVERWTAIIRRYCGEERIFRPHSTCPICSHLGALTVWANEDTLRAERARCGHCGTGWDPTSVGILLEHIRAAAKTRRRVTTLLPTGIVSPAGSCPSCGKATEVSREGRRRCGDCHLEIVGAA